MDTNEIELRAGMYGLGAVNVSYNEQLAAYFIEIEERADERATVLNSWVEGIDIVDVRSGTYSEADPDIRLHIRGFFRQEGVFPPLFPDGQIIAVSAAWPKGSPEGRAIERGVMRGKSGVYPLLDALLVLEGANAA